MGVYALLTIFLLLLVRDMLMRGPRDGKATSAA